MKNDLKIKQLINMSYNRKGQSLSHIFVKLATDWGMKKNSVRNLYYMVMKKLQTDNDYAKNMGLDSINLSKVEIKQFTKKEIDWLIYEVEHRVKSGMSIRKACIELAGGDVTLMLRYQNKYRSIKCKKDNEKNSNNNINKNNGKVYKFTSLNSSIPNNVIPFRKKETSLSESELQSLFMGLVRIVRSSAVADVNNALKDQYNRQAIEIRNLLKNLSRLKDELMESQRENARIKKELQLLKTDKVEKYANFMTNLRSKNMHSFDMDKKS